MDLPEYITKEEVQRVCAELGLEDWTALEAPRIPAAEAEIIRKEVGSEALAVSLEAFHAGLEVELEHGVVFSDSNVTNNHPILTGKIVVAHLKEMLDYYERLEVAELEGDLLKAVKAGNAKKAAGYYRRLAAARRALADAEAGGFE